MNASLPELCIVTLGRMFGAGGVLAGRGVDEDGLSGVVGVEGAGGARGVVVNERNMLSRESVDP